MQKLTNSQRESLESYLEDSEHDVLIEDVTELLNNDGYTHNHFTNMIEDIIGKYEHYGNLTDGQAMAVKAHLRHHANLWY